MPPLNCIFSITFGTDTDISLESLLNHGWANFYFDSIEFGEIFGIHVTDRNKPNKYEIFRQVNIVKVIKILYQVLKNVATQINGNIM